MIQVKNKVPILAIIGRPNVGKSSLFNRFARDSQAIVDDQPGVTRDSLYATGSLHEKSFIVIDTAGMERVRNPFRQQLDKQMEMVMHDADEVLLVVDQQQGLTGADEVIIERLRKQNTEFILLVNKSEGISPDIACAEFTRTGCDRIHAISAKRGSGCEQLLQQLLDRYSGISLIPASAYPRITILGRPNAGKSTLFNRLCGQERALIAETPHTTRDAIAFDFQFKDGRYTLIDTAGMRKKRHIHDPLESMSVAHSIHALRNCDLCILLLDGRAGIGMQDAVLAGLIHSSRRPHVVAVNKCEKFSTEDKIRIDRGIQRRLAFIDHQEIRFISAKMGSGLGALMDAVNLTIHSATMQLSTATLNKHLRRAVESKSPPASRSGSFPKLKFAHQCGFNPPMVRIHGNQLQTLPVSYRRYLANYFRRAYRLHGTSVHIQLRNSINPYDNALAGNYPKKR